MSKALISKIMKDGLELQTCQKKLCETQYNIAQDQKKIVQEKANKIKINNKLNNKTRQEAFDRLHKETVNSKASTDIISCSVKNCNEIYKKTIYNLYISLDLEYKNKAKPKKLLTLKKIVNQKSITLEDVKKCMILVKEIINEM